MAPTVIVVLLLLAATAAGALTARRGAERAEAAALDQRLEDAASVAKALSDQVVSALSDTGRVAALTQLDPATFAAAVRPRLTFGALRRIALVDGRGPTPRVIAAAGGAPQLIDRFDPAMVAVPGDDRDGVVRAAQDSLLAPTLLAYARAVERYPGVVVWAEVDVESVVESFFVANDDLRGSLYLGTYPDAVIMLATNARRDEEVPRTGAHIDVTLGADGAGFLVGAPRTPLIPRWAALMPWLVLLAGLLLTVVVALLVESVRRARVAAERRAARDALTGLASRDRFLDALAAELAAGGAPAVCLVDLDDFKTVNDARGHGAGDRLLRGVADRLRAAAGGSALVARLGGDEFAILARDGEAQAVRIAERVADGLVPPIVTADLEARVRASTGIAVARAGTTPAHLLRDADLAMYHAKREGRSGFHVFDGSLLVAVDERLALQQALPGAIADGAVHVHYQPIVAVPGGAVMGFEALARWSHDGAPVSPAVFVPLAVDAGLMAELGGGVARAALADLEALRALAPAARLFLNVSARELEHDGYAERLLAALAAAGASPADVVLELTESELAREGVADACHALRDRGFAFAIDDFGAGWSNLGYLRTLLVEVVKVDRGLLGSGDAAADRKLLEGLVALARSLGIAALCEGVETEAQRDLVAAAGFDAAQGYLLGRPAPLAELAGVRAA